MGVAGHGRKKLTYIRFYPVIYERVFLSKRVNVGEKE
jgi:hypothetical protein